MEHFEEEERERQTDIRTRNRKEKKAFSKKKKEEQGVYPGFGFENFNIDFTAQFVSIQPQHCQVVEMT
jgi:hypothetical protein